MPDLLPIDPEAVGECSSALPEAEILELVVSAFEALADPTRAKLLYALLRRPLCVRDLAITVGATESAVSHQLRILRDLAVHLTAWRPVTGWAEITTADLEGWIARTANRRHQLTYVLRGFFAWAKRRKLILVDPARPLRLVPSCSPTCSASTRRCTSPST